jgi:hypothetical protein
LRFDLVVVMVPFALSVLGLLVEKVEGRKREGERKQ